MNTESSLGYNPIEIYSRIEKLFLSNGMKATQEEIAKFIGVTQKSVAKWKTSIPGSDNLIRIANKFNVSLDWLVYGKEPTPNATTQDNMKIEDICHAIIKACDFSKIKVTNSNVEELVDPLTGPETLTLEITPYNFEHDINECENYCSWCNYIRGDALILQQFLVNATLVNRSGASEKLKEKQLWEIFNEIKNNINSRTDENGFLGNVYNPHGFYEKECMF